MRHFRAAGRLTYTKCSVQERRTESTAEQFDETRKNWGKKRKRDKVGTVVRGTGKRDGVDPQRVVSSCIDHFGANLTVETEWPGHEAMGESQSGASVERR